MKVFSRATRDWFTATFAAPTEVQRRGWEPIAGGEHTLLVAPTGSGKTLAAFLWGIDTINRCVADAPPGVRVLYVSPLKALVYDIERNLRAPLVGIQRTTEALGSRVKAISVGVRTGDTPQKERRRQARDPADILVTTPESLYLLLGSQARETLRNVHTVIVDEIHALAPTKRGAHLALSLERLVELTLEDPQRIGLSATVRPQALVAGFLGGHRPVEVIDAAATPRLDVEVVVPVPDMENVEPNTDTRRESEGGSILGELYAREVGTPRSERGVWPAIYPELLQRIHAHRSTLIFVNSRGLCERLAQRLNELAGEELVRAHHGSVSIKARSEIEDALKRGEIRAIVATSSLELGIDMGAIDLVVLVESPGSVARGLQRVGRAGHRVDTTSVGHVFPKFRGDLLECAVVAQRMLHGEIETVKVPENPLDVLAQQLVAMCCDQPRGSAALEGIVRRAYPFRHITSALMNAVLEMLAGNYPSVEFAELRPRLSWDRTTNTLSARRGAAMITRVNAGTIPDRGNYGVYIGTDGPRVGELDEEMVFETRAGENILLGATTWRVEQISRDRVIVAPAPGEPGRLPFWRGEGPGRPLELGQAIGAFTRKIASMGQDKAVRYLRDKSPLGEFAAENLSAYILEQKKHTGSVPSDQSITVERFRDELGDWRVCILSPFGAKVHAPWAMALEQILSQHSGFEIQLMYTDDGIVLRFTDMETAPKLDVLFPDPDDIENLITNQLGDTSLFSGLFRENAVRSLLLPRRRPNERTPLWSQRIKAQNLLAVVKRYPSFPIVLETYRQCLRDEFDIAALQKLLRRIRSREIQVYDVETTSASPFARSLVFAYVAAYIYSQDSPLAERKAQALTIDRNLLNELLGQAELRELIDVRILLDLEAELQCLDEDRRATDANELHDLLRRVGDLTTEEIQLRCIDDPEPWLLQLERERRAILIAVGDEKRWIVAEEAALYRDALGAMPPSGLPKSHLASVDRPLEQIVLRYARRHGPFLTVDVAARLGLRPAQIEPVLQLLESEGTIVRGEIRPGGIELEWCDADILRRIKRRTLAKLRHEIAPVDAYSLGDFLPKWHAIGADRLGIARLEEVIDQLEGLPLPWSLLSATLLPMRVAGFSLDMLDMLSATGAVVWIGVAPLGIRDGRIALYRRSQVSRLAQIATDYQAPSAVHAALCKHLETRGASFLVELEHAVKDAVANTSRVEFNAALWDLVWAGQITNDTFSPLRSLASTGAHSARDRRRSGHTLAGGRWSLVRNLLDPAVTDTERAVARANMLLERHGIVCRETVSAEDLPGGFAPIYRVLKAMEESGQVRRGYFIEGLSGAQFGHSGAVDRLRAARSNDDSVEAYSDETALALPTLDPANPYGAMLPWPPTGASDDSRLRRVPKTWVILVEGKPALYVGANGRQLWTFPNMVDASRGGLTAAFHALHRLPGATGRGVLVVEKIDGLPAIESPHYAAMKSCGFCSDYRGLSAEKSYR